MHTVEFCPTCHQEVMPIHKRLLSDTDELLMQIERFDMTPLKGEHHIVVSHMAKAMNLLYKASDEIRRLREHKNLATKLSIDKGVIDIVHRLENCNCQKMDEAKALCQEAAIWLAAMGRYIQEEKS